MASLSCRFRSLGAGALLLVCACSSDDEPLPPFVPPSCLRALTEDCPPEGTCGVDIIVSVTGDATCDPNGEHREQVTEVRSPDGKLCYTFVTASGGGLCEGPSLTWKDPAGNVVAHGGGLFAAVTCEPGSHALPVDNSVRRLARTSPLAGLVATEGAVTPTPPWRWAFERNKTRGEGT
jgi:hypothetical protein